MNGYTLAAVIAVCVTALLCALIWAAVRINQTKGK
jgi:hypothetical protein